METSYTDIEGRWSDIDKVIKRTGPFVAPDFQPDTNDSPSIKTALQNDFKILVIGAGGLGCELLKNLALSGFRNIDVIDMDTIDVSNLNRQFLFRRKDVGKSKAEVAAAFINQRVAGCKVTPYKCKIQDKDEDYYRQFKLIIAGLDSIEARRWINGLLVNLVVTDTDGNIDPLTIIPLIDGGTEGFKGQARVILPRISSCFECSLESFPPQTTYAICTIANTPRVPEHCIQWALIFGLPDAAIPKPFDPKVFDNDNPVHMTWLYETAKKRAEDHNINGVTYKLTQGVAKNIIPAIASTNAIIAAACCNEAFKICTDSSGYLDNYMMYNGQQSVYTYTFNYEVKEGCAVCGSNIVSYEVSPKTLLSTFLEDISKDSRFQFKKPSLRCNGRNLYMQGLLHQSTVPNLEKSLEDLQVGEGDEITITDPSLPVSITSIILLIYHDVESESEEETTTTSTNSFTPSVNNQEVPREKVWEKYAKRSRERTDHRTDQNQCRKLINQILKEYKAGSHVSIEEVRAKAIEAQTKKIQSYFDNEFQTNVSIKA
ncbi:ubiquitin-activating enzyme E1C [Heterostelium album PN500]|uniref:NEDD8-activating enzyme E1 catalytic subunit n=1 Tax=Heterostelium pallidum (strain ATCC 26659 / Pp 5 / PN500) TaxID=670386 RepID=D3AWC6_HETP5|nr:ubiquitin-activating enzyme E1C [Heterostelium album PN500]EFA86599.1 ubiquitin-activating enzyme E1C [Heterostelium album PN500]|eukprot:XP_020438704.1 ubiquitin-activating enzyme E1C [Heterostelium album PN500]